MSRRCTALFHETVDIGGLAADLYLPRGPVDAGVVFLHGGGFVGGSRSQFGPLCRRLSGGGPVACLSLDYRLAPAHPFPAPVQDAVSAFRWLGRRTGLGPGRLFLAGGSPGGCIAALAVLAGEAQLARWGVPAGARPRQAMLLNGICDLPGFYENNPCERARVDGFLAGRPGGLREADPSAYRPAGRRLLLLHGTADTVVTPAQCRAFADGLRRAGSRVDTVWFYGKPHAWFNLPGQFASVAAEMGEYLRQALKE